MGGATFHRQHARAPAFGIAGSSYVEMKTSVDAAKARLRAERHVRALIDWPVWERAEAVQAVDRRSVRDLVGAWREAGR